MQVEQVTLESKEALVAFLKEREEYSLFLLSNLERCGVALTDALYSGNFKVLLKEGKIIAAFCLTRRGSLLVESQKQDQAVYEAIFSSCQKEEIPLLGVLGEWGFASSLWDFFKQKGIIPQTTWEEKEVLYALDVRGTTYQHEKDVRLLQKQDVDAFYTLRAAYVQEMGFPPHSKEEVHREFLDKVVRQESWGLFYEGRLVAIADLNAHVADLAQLGGVYTVPEFRKKGFSSRLTRHLISDLKHIHRVRKLVIFTGENNRAARKVYESLGIVPQGYYALLFKG